MQGYHGHLSFKLLYIGNEAFADCISLSGIEIPSTVTHLGNNVFNGCESMERIVLNDGLLEIGEGAFENCTSLTEIVIPESVKIIGHGAFDNPELIITVISNEEEAPSTYNSEWVIHYKDIIFVKPEDETTSAEAGNDTYDSIFN